MDEDQGLPVIPLTSRNDDPRQPQITEDSVRRWVNAHPLSFGRGRGAQTIEKIELLTGRELDRKRFNLRVGDERLLYIVTLRGNFLAKPPTNLIKGISSTIGMQVFDARTGGLLLEVVVGEK